MIGKMEGGKIIFHYELAQTTPIILVQKFDLNVKDDHPIYEVWLTNSDDAGLKFIEQFEEFHLKFNGTVTMIP